MVQSGTGQAGAQAGRPEWQGAAGKRADGVTELVYEHRDVVLDGQEDRGTRPEQQGH